LSVNPSNPDFFVLGVAKSIFIFEASDLPNPKPRMQGLDSSPASRARVGHQSKVSTNIFTYSLWVGGDGASYRRFLIEPHYCGLKEYKVHVSISIRADRHRGNFPVLFRIFTGSTKALPFRGIMASRLPSMRVQPHFAQRPFYLQSTLLVKIANVAELLVFIG